VAATRSWIAAVSVSPPARTDSSTTISPWAIAATSVEPAPMFATRTPSVVATETRAPIAAAIGLSIK
jgi:hypothetical protein